VINPLKNLAINIRAAGPAAVVIVLILATVTLGMWGKGELAGRAMSAMDAVGVALIVVLAAKVRGS
jgi:hypothetical protein